MVVGHAGTRAGSVARPSEVVDDDESAVVGQEPCVGASQASSSTGDDNDPGIRRARTKHNPEPLGWKLLEPIAFVDSGVANGLLPAGVLRPVPPVVLAPLRPPRSSSIN